VINSYFEHLCRALKHDGSNANLTHAAAVAHAEHIIDPLEESRAMRDVRSTHVGVEGVVISFINISLSLSISRTHAHIYIYVGRAGSDGLLSS